MQHYSNQSANQQELVYPQHLALYHGDYPNPQHLQREGTQFGAPVEQQGSTSQPPHPRPNELPSRWQNASSGFFNQAHGFIIKDSILVNSNSDDSFMASLLEQTIKGAEFDSSDRNMPLRCHPGTRLEIIKRCQDFILNRDGRPKLRWVVGSAGVGKSAIMQSIAHHQSNVLSETMGATIFFANNGRQNGTKTITTIAYQLAVKIEPYRLFLQREVTRDPSLLQKSLSKQFNTFIIEPFIHQRIVDRYSCLLIIIDGLDECVDISIQKELLGLISDCCVTYPTSPILWIVASRPEPHIASFFSQPKVALSYEKEDILVDSDYARDDVERYLRDKFREVQMESITLQELSQWPSEGNLREIVNASGGLFAYASTVLKYIGDPDCGDPDRLLRDVLEIIETGTKRNIWGRNHPMEHLDALYSHIMSKIPDNVMADTRKLLLLSGIEFSRAPSFQLLSNILGISRNAAYGATHHIRSIAIVPGPSEAAEDSLQFFHKSFLDYLRDFERSGFSQDFDSEAEQLMYFSALRILEQAPDGVYVGDAYSYDLRVDYGLLKNGPGTGENIAVSWSAPIYDDRRLRLNMFRQAVQTLVKGTIDGVEVFRNLLCMRVLSTCFTYLPERFPFGNVQDFLFNECRRRELLECGMLKQVTLDTIEYDMIGLDYIQLQFRGLMVQHPHPWNTLCDHEREGTWEGPMQDWSTHFDGLCCHCFERFARQFKMLCPGHLVTVLELVPSYRLAEFRFIDPDDNVSDWTYYFYAEDRYIDEDEEDGKGKDKDGVGSGEIEDVVEWEKSMQGDPRTLEHNALPEDDFDDEELEAYAGECARLAASEVVVDIPEEDLFQLSNHYFQLSYAEEVGSSFDPGVEDMDVWEIFMRGDSRTLQQHVVPDEDFGEEELEAYAEECERQAALGGRVDVPGKHSIIKRP